MSELTAKQIEFLNELLKGRPVAAIVEDLEIHYKELVHWKTDPLFVAEMQAINDYMQFLRETDIRIGATEALRRASITVGGYMSGDHWMSDRQRRVGLDLVRLARALDPDFRLKYRRSRTRDVQRTAIREETLSQSYEVVQRMERLRERILEERRREREEQEKRGQQRALPAPDAPETDE